MVLAFIDKRWMWNAPPAACGCIVFVFICGVNFKSEPLINADARRFKKIQEPDNRVFLKELNLTEGRNTGFRKIRKALQNNGSPEPVFKTDD